MQNQTIPYRQSLMRTRCGRTIAVSRLDPGVLPVDLGRTAVDTACKPYERNEVRAPLTPTGAREPAGLLMQQATAVEEPPAGQSGHLAAVGVRGDVYAITTRGHLLTVDQPVAEGGTDTGPTPVELLVAALAGCIAHDAGRHLDRHRIPRDGLRVSADHTMASGSPARVGTMTLRPAVPALPPERAEALLAAVRHRAVHNTPALPPEVTIVLDPER